jgi:glutaredoxin
LFNIFGRTTCVWCDRAKALLEQEGLPYQFFNIEEDRTAYSIFRGHFPDAKTVPKITEDDIQIGGYEDLVEWLKKQ